MNVSDPDMTIEDYGQPTEPGTSLWDQRRKLLMAQRTEEIREYGHAWAGVFGDVAWIFTIGLLPGHPELILIGADKNVLATMGEQVISKIRSGDRYKHGDVIELGDEEATYLLRVVAFNHQPTGGEHGWFNQHPMAALPGMFSAVQLVWPGTHVDDPDAELFYPTATEPWNDQPVLGDIWW